MKLRACVVNGTEPGQWVLHEPLKFKEWIVPSYFKCDGASIPWGVQWLIKKGGSVFPCAVLHDYLYRYNIVPREEADRIFLEAMEYNGVPKWKRLTMYRAVRAFGFLPYNKHTRRLQYEPDCK